MAPSPSPATTPVTPTSWSSSRASARRCAPSNARASPWSSSPTRAAWHAGCSTSPPWTPCTTGSALFSPATVSASTASTPAPTTRRARCPATAASARAGSQPPACSTKPPTTSILTLPDRGRSETPPVTLVPAAGLEPSLHSSALSRLMCSQMCIARRPPARSVRYYGPCLVSRLGKVCWARFPLTDTVADAIGRSAMISQSWPMVASSLVRARFPGACRATVQDARRAHQCGRRVAARERRQRVTYAAEVVSGPPAPARSTEQSSTSCSAGRGDGSGNAEAAEV